jgi:hypothetical protein
MVKKYLNLTQEAHKNNTKGMNSIEKRAKGEKIKEKMQLEKNARLSGKRDLYGKRRNKENLELSNLT